MCSIKRLAKRILFLFYKKNNSQKNFPGDAFDHTSTCSHVHTDTHTEEIRNFSPEK